MLNKLKTVPNVGLEKLYASVALNKNKIAEYWQHKNSFSTHSNEWEQTKEYTQSDFRNDVSTLDDVKRVLGRKWKNCLKNRVYTFVDYLLYATPKEGIIERPLSTQNAKLLDRLGNEEKVRRTRKDLVDLDVLKLTSDYHWSGVGTPIDFHGCQMNSSLKAYAYRYIINRKQVEFIWHLCRSLFGELKFDHQANLIKQIEELDGLEVDDEMVEKMLSRCSFGTRKHLSVKKFKDRKTFEATMVKGLCIKYPFLKPYMLKRQELNRKLHQRTEGNFFPTFHYSNTGNHCTKIGMRDWNDCCNLKSKNVRELVRIEGKYIWKTVENDSYKGEWFKPVCKSILESNDIYNFDVKSSVPRVLWFLKHGEWLSNEIDIYELINGAPFSSSIMRDCCKEFVLRVLFSSSVSEILNNIRPAIEEELKTSRLLKSCGCKTQGPEDYVAYLKDRLDSLFGKIDGTLVFVIESCLYMDVEEKLQSLEIPYIKKFDAFYSSDSRVGNVLFMEGLLKEVTTSFKNSNETKDLFTNSLFNDTSISPNLSSVSRGVNNIKVGEEDRVEGNTVNQHIGNSHLTTLKTEHPKTKVEFQNFVNNPSIRLNKKGWEILYCSVGETVDQSTTTDQVSNESYNKVTTVEDMLI